MILRYSARPRIGQGARSVLEISVMDGDRLVQRCPCRPVQMPDGSDGALWRGVAYPLMPGNTIDVSTARPVSPPDIAAASPVAAHRHAVLPGDDVSWILIEGLADRLEAARAALAAAGLAIIRTGRWLGEPLDGVVFDWYLRLEEPLDAATVAGVLGTPAPPAELSRDVEFATLHCRLADLTAEQARLRAELAARSAVPAPPTAVADHPPAMSDDGARDAAQSELIEAYRRINELETLVRQRDAHRATLPKSVATLHDELGEALKALRPDIVLLRDSLRVATGEWADRTSLYRAIQELPMSGKRPEGGQWKPLKAAERVWERHLSTGQADDARIYARFSTNTRQWQVLLGWKLDQTHDISWLSKHP